MVSPLSPFLFPTPATAAPNPGRGAADAVSAALFGTMVDGGRGADPSVELAPAVDPARPPFAVPGSGLPPLAAAEAPSAAIAPSPVGYFPDAALFAIVPPPSGASAPMLPPSPNVPETSSSSFGTVPAEQPVMPMSRPVATGTLVTLASSTAVALAIVEPPVAETPEPASTSSQSPNPIVGQRVPPMRIERKERPATARQRAHDAPDGGGETTEVGDRSLTPPVPADLPVPLPVVATASASPMAAGAELTPDPATRATVPAEIASPEAARAVAAGVATARPSAAPAAVDRAATIDAGGSASPVAALSPSAATDDAALPARKAAADPAAPAPSRLATPTTRPSPRSIAPAGPNAELAPVAVTGLAQHIDPQSIALSDVGSQPPGEPRGPTSTATDAPLLSAERAAPADERRSSPSMPLADVLPPIVVDPARRQVTTDDSPHPYPLPTPPVAGTLSMPPSAATTATALPPALASADPAATPRSVAAWRADRFAGTSAGERRTLPLTIATPPAPPTSTQVDDGRASSAASAAPSALPAPPATLVAPAMSVASPTPSAMPAGIQAPPSITIAAADAIAASAPGDVPAANRAARGSTAVAPAAPLPFAAIPRTDLRAERAALVATAADEAGPAARPRPRSEPAFRAFATAMFDAVREAPAPAPVPPAAQGAPIDLTQGRWPHAMVDRIERLRDEASLSDTRIRLVPDALGTIDVALRRDGDTVHVAFHAEQAETRRLLAEARPELTALAETRGIKLADAAPTTGGWTGGPAPQGQGGGNDRAPGRQPQPSTPAAPPRAAIAAEQPDDDIRIA